VGASLKDGGIGFLGLTAEIDDQGQQAVIDIAAGQGSEVICPLAMGVNAELAQDAVIAIVIPVAFAIGAGAQDVVLNFEATQFLGQMVGQDRFAGLGRSSDEERWQFAGDGPIFVVVHIFLLKSDKKKRESNDA
jgi:hypothetical protein